MGVGALVGLVYGLASLTQVWSGHLADRFPLKRVYLVTLAAQFPCSCSARPDRRPAAGPAGGLAGRREHRRAAGRNLLLSASAPGHRQATAFGLRFVLIFGTTPFAIALVSWLGRSPAGFAALFVVLAGLATIAALAALALPSPTAERSPAASQFAAGA